MQGWFSGELINASDYSLNYGFLSLHPLLVVGRGVKSPSTTIFEPLPLSDEKPRQHSGVRLAETGEDSTQVQRDMGLTSKSRD